MKRFALAILLVAAVAGSLFLAFNRPGAEASPDATITVDSKDDKVNPDEWMTLREAIMLATGDLILSDLTLQECGQVSDTVFLPPCLMGPFADPPGAPSADTIVFDTTVFPPGSPETIYLGDTLPALDTDDDTVDGSAAGVIVEGGGVPYFHCFRITSDHNTIKGLSITECKVGVRILDGAQNNTVGGSTEAERNVISGNGTGVSILDSGTDGNTVKGNYIGTNAAGDAATANQIGVFIDQGKNNTVGGSTTPGQCTGDCNVISGNSSHGVLIVTVGCEDNTVKGNFIGTNAAGDAAIPNGFPGVNIGSGARNNTVEGNLISGNNLAGVQIYSTTTSGNVVKGNLIGTDAAGTSAIPNDDFGGVHIHMGANNNTVGGTTAAEGNVIAFNVGDGVLVEDTGGTGNTIRGNSIHSNGGKGISLVDGGNSELESPTVESAGSVFGTACPDCTIDVYSDDEDEGTVYEGSTTADADGNWTLSTTPEGPNITATATDSDGNTSEFSAPLEPPWPTPTPEPSPTPTTTPTPGPTPTSDGDGDTVPDDIEEAFGSDPEDDGSTPESLAYDPGTCSDGVDNDGDGLTDAEDDGCVDSDGDGFDDATEERLDSDPNDPDSTPEHAAIPGTCTDGLDNDGDGLTDGDDEACPVTSTRTLVWGPGWHNVTWSGSSTPEETFACAAGNYAAAYRLVGAGWERYFPDRLDISNMTDLAQYDTFFILITNDVTCNMPVADPPGTQRTLDWGMGWHNDGWTGPDGTDPQDAFACADGSYAAAYRLVNAGWERHFPDRLDISNMGPLDQYDAFLILVTAPVSCTMPIAP